MTGDKWLVLGEWWMMGGGLVSWWVGGWVGGWAGGWVGRWVEWAFVGGWVGGFGWVEGWLLN